MTVIDRIETFRRGRDLTLVRVTTDDGDVGWGQTSTFIADATTLYLHDVLAEAFLGSDPWSAASVTDRVVRSEYKTGGTVLFRALCGMDTALLDLVGRRAGVPVYRLLGGPVRTRLPVYGSSMRRDITPEDEIDRMQDLKDRLGFTAFKVRVGKAMSRDSDASPRRTEAIIRLARERLGDDVDLMADANGSFSAARAIEVGRMLEEQRFFHFEEPCPYEEHHNTRAVAAALDIRVAGGEQDNSLAQFHQLIAGNVVDVIQPDVGYIGGVRRALQVAAMADAAGIPFTPHVANHSLLQVFTAHLFAASPAATQYLEWGIEVAPWEADLYSGEPAVQEGHITLAEAPGWGIEIDESVFSRHEYRESRGARQ